MWILFVITECSYNRVRYNRVLYNRARYNQVRYNRFSLYFVEVTLRVRHKTLRLFSMSKMNRNLRNSELKLNATSKPSLTVSILRLFPRDISENAYNSNSEHSRTEKEIHSWKLTLKTFAFRWNSIKVYLCQILYNFMIA